MSRNWALAVFTLLSAAGLFSCGDNASRAAAKRGPLKDDLLRIHALQIDCFAEYSTYCGTFELLDFQPSPNSSYAFFLPGDALYPETARVSGPPDTVLPRVNEKGFLAVAAGNIDRDPTLDVWTVNQDFEIENLVDDLAR